MSKFRILEKTDDTYTVSLKSSPANIILLSLVNLVKTHVVLRIFTLISGTVSFVGTFIVYIYVKQELMIYLGLFGLGTGMLIIYALSSGMFTLIFEPDSATSAIKEREEAETAYEQDTKDPFTYLDVDTKRLNEYYLINQNQSKNSFSWAVFAMFVGLSTIVAGIWFFYLSNDKQQRNDLLAALTTIAGVILNIVSGLYIYLHNKSQKRSLIYFNQLVRNQQLGLSIRLAEGITDDIKKIEAVNKIIIELLAIVKLQTNQDLNRILNDAGSEEIKQKT